MENLEEIIFSEIIRKHQKLLDDEVNFFLSGNGTGCELEGFFLKSIVNNKKIDYLYTRS